MPLGCYYFPWRNVQVNKQAIVVRFAERARSLSYATGRYRLQNARSQHSHRPASSRAQLCVLKLRKLGTRHWLSRSPHYSSTHFQVIGKRSRSMLAYETPRLHCSIVRKCPPTEVEASVFAHELQRIHKLSSAERFCRGNLYHVQRESQGAHQHPVRRGHPSDLERKTEVRIRHEAYSLWPCFLK